MITTTQPQSFEQRLDEAPLSRVMWQLWALSAGLIALDGFDFFIIGVALPFLQRDFDLGPGQMGAIATAAIAGSLVGSLTLGPITDKVGRQRMLLVDIALFVVATLGTALAWNTVSLIFFRFLVGVAIGADYPISVAYITENVPSRLRGRLVIGAFTFQAVGALLGAVTGLGVLQGFERAGAGALLVGYGWRWMLGVGLVLAIAVGLLRLTLLLESPRYYLAKGDYAAASEAATALLGQPVYLSPESDPPAAEPAPLYGALFGRYRRSLALAAIPWFLQDIATYGIGIFTPTILAALAFAQSPDFVTQAIASARGAAGVDVFLIVGFLLAVGLVERAGRMRLQIVGFLGMAAGLGLLAAASGQPEGALRLGLVFGGFLLFNLMMNAGPNATTFLLSGEVFPTAIRASGAGLAAAIAKAGAVLGTFGLPLLQSAWGVGPLLLALALVCLLAAALTYGFRIETTGRSLEAVAAGEDGLTSAALSQPKTAG